MFRRHFGHHLAPLVLITAACCVLAGNRTATAADPRPRIEVVTILDGQIKGAAPANDTVDDVKVKDAVSVTFINQVQRRWEFVKWVDAVPLSPAPPGAPNVAGRVTLHIEAFRDPALNINNYRIWANAVLFPPGANPENYDFKSFDLQLKVLPEVTFAEWHRIIASARDALQEFLAKDVGYNQVFDDFLVKLPLCSTIRPAAAPDRLLLALQSDPFHLSDDCEFLIRVFMTNPAAQASQARFRAQKTVDVDGAIEAQIVPNSWVAAAGTPQFPVFLQLPNVVTRITVCLTSYRRPPGGESMTP